MDVDTAVAGLLRPKRPSSGSGVALSSRSTEWGGVREFLVDVISEEYVLLHCPRLSE